MNIGGTVNRVEVEVSATDRTAAGLQSAEQRLRATGQAMTQTGKSMMRAGGIITGAMGVIFTSTMKYGVAIDKARIQTGLTAEEMQRLWYAAEQEHASMETLNKALPIFTRYAREAANGMETYAREFRNMGIEVVDAEGNLRPINELLMGMADYMSNEGVSAQEKLGTAMALLGRRGAELIPLFSLGRSGLEALGNELEATRGTMDAAQAGEFKAMSDSMTKLKTTFAGVKDEIAIGLLPVVEHFTAVGQRFAGWLRSLDPQQVQLIGRIVTLGGVLLVAGGGFLFIAGQVAFLAANIIHFIPILTKFAAVFTAKMGAMSISMLPLLLKAIAFLAVLEGIQAIWGIFQARKDTRAAQEDVATSDRLRAAYEAGDLTREEMLAGMHALSARGEATRKRVGAEGYATTLGQRTMRDLGQMTQIMASFNVSKEDEMPAEFAEVLRPIMAGT